MQKQISCYNSRSTILRMDENDKIKDRPGVYITDLPREPGSLTVNCSGLVVSN